MGDVASLAAPRDKSCPRHVWAQVIEVAGRDRSRLELVVWCVCGRQHMHRASMDFIAGVRRGPCGARYVVHAVVTEAAAA